MSDYAAQTTTLAEEGVGVTLQSGAQATLFPQTEPGVRLIVFSSPHGQMTSLKASDEALKALGALICLVFRQDAALLAERDAALAEAARLREAGRPLHAAAVAAVGGLKSSDNRRAVLAIACMDWREAAKGGEQ